MYFTLNKDVVWVFAGKNVVVVCFLWVCHLKKQIFMINSNTIELFLNIDWEVLATEQQYCQAVICILDFSH